MAAAPDSITVTLRLDTDTVARQLADLSTAMRANGGRSLADAVEATSGVALVGPPPEDKAITREVGYTPLNRLWFAVIASNVVGFAAGGLTVLVLVTR